MSVLLKYVRHLVKAGLIDEFHAWDFTRTEEDSAWLRSELVTSRKAATWTTVAACAGYHYHELKHAPEFPTRPLTLRFRAESDAHLLLHDDDGDVAEIVLGGWDNTACAIRTHRQGSPVVTQQFGLDKREWHEVTVTVSGDSLSVRVDDSKEMQTCALRAAAGLRVSVSAWNGKSCEWATDVRPSQERLMPVRDKSNWSEYYAHYTPQAYPNSIIIKCDDDVVYIDPAGFYRFTQYVSRDMGNHLFAFPFIVNNGVCAHFMQEAGLLPEDEFGKFPLDTFEGRLWGDGRLTQRVHAAFAARRAEFVRLASELPPRRLQSGSRFSINFFAVRSEDLGRTFNACGRDDEHDLTVRMTDRLQRSHVLVPALVVAHLSFYRQRETGLDADESLAAYEQVSAQVLPL